MWRILGTMFAMSAVWVSTSFAQSADMSGQIDELQKIVSKINQETAFKGSLTDLNEVLLESRSRFAPLAKSEYLWALGFISRNRTAIKELSAEAESSVASIFGKNSENSKSQSQIITNLISVLNVRPSGKFLLPVLGFGFKIAVSNSDEATSPLNKAQSEIEGTVVSNVWDKTTTFCLNNICQVFDRHGQNQGICLANGEDLSRDQCRYYGSSYYRWVDLYTVPVCIKGYGDCQ